MKKILIFIILLNITLISSLNISINTPNIEGEYLNQTITINNTNIRLFCDSYNESLGIYRELLSPNNKTIIINSPIYSFNITDVGEYSYICKISGKEVLTSEFYVSDDISSKTINDKMNIVIIIFLTLIGVIIAITIIFYITTS